MSTDELLPRLEELAAELKVRDRPERRAWYRLGPNRSGWTAQPHDTSAFELWHGLHRRFPRDYRPVHHLAIMYHARALDLELSDRPGRSDADWQQASAFWHRLYEADEFWADLSQRVDANPDPVPAVREDLAKRLLGMHFAIALDEHSPHHRARFHIRLALKSAFPKVLVEQIRTSAYEGAIAGLDAAVWQPGTFDPATLKPAVDTVTGYLDLDDDCPAALSDLLGLLNRLQTGQIHKVNAIAEERRSRRALVEVRDTARDYDRYISKLEQKLLKSSERDALALSDLALWFSRAGQACQASNAYELAIAYYQRALNAARAGDDPRAEEFRAGWLLSTVLAARKSATSDAHQARKLLAGIKKYEALPGDALFVRAQAWMLLGEFRLADQDAEDALTALDSSDRRADYRIVREQLDQLRKQFTSYGGPEAFRLQQEAVKAFNDGRYEEAIELARSARSAAGPGAAAKHNELLAACLNAAACESVERDAQGGSSLDQIRGQLAGLDLPDHLLKALERQGLQLPRPLGRDRLAIVVRAEKMLAEAVALDPKPVYRQNLDQARLLRRKLEGGYW